MPKKLNKCVVCKKSIPTKHLTYVKSLPVHDTGKCRQDAKYLYDSKY